MKIACLLYLPVSDVARQLLKFPHYTAARPVTVLYCGREGSPSFRDKLFVRGLVSTLIGNMRFRSSAVPAMVPELVWWDMLQPRLGMQDADLARCVTMEPHESCL